MHLCESKVLEGTDKDKKQNRQSPDPWKEKSRQLGYFFAMQWSNENLSTNIKSNFMMMKEKEVY